MDKENKKKRGSNSENLELAKEHVEIAKDLVVEEARKNDDEENKRLKDIEFSLERAGAGIEELEENPASS